jgi:pSer/pThr/pTyr-binding forkhead associated (FHA) protein
MSTLLATPILRLRTGPSAGKVYDVRSALRLGRHPYNEVSIPDAAVSRYHCWITFDDGVAFVEDLASANGTYLNGERVTTRLRLKDGDLIRLGSTEFHFSEAA